MTVRIAVGVVFAGALLLLPLSSSGAPVQQVDPAAKAQKSPLFPQSPKQPRTVGNFTVMPDGTVQDSRSTRIWELAPGTARVGWKAAKAACDARVFAGKSDWRLPRIEEFTALVGSNGLPAGHPFKLPDGGEFWTSTDTSPDIAYSLLAFNGGQFYSSMGTEKLVWCVRGGGNTAYPNSNLRFSVVGDAVRDTKTGRLWARKRGTTGDWYAARSGCMDRGADWRLATLAEAKTLLDLGAPESPKLPPGHPFTNTWSPYDTAYVWMLDSSPGGATVVRLSDGHTEIYGNQINTLSGWCIQGNASAAWPTGPLGRFVTQKDGSVLDQESKLIWEMSPASTLDVLGAANTACAAKNTGGQSGWRLPTALEFGTLVDRRATTAVKLPPDHPFQNAQAGQYWTGDVLNTWEVSTMHLDTGKVGRVRYDWTMLRWCVRMA